MNSESPKKKSKKLLYKLKIVGEFFRSAGLQTCFFSYAFDSFAMCQQIMLAFRRRNC